MPKTKVEVYDKDQLIYPYIESDHVTFSNGMKVSEMLDQSISMPTITHNETSFKVGVGDSDVSSSIVDSSVSKMVIKGQTYQNILPEPSTHVLTNNKEMFKVNEGLDPNVEIVDGVSKSAILKGQTLNNIALTINNTIHKNAGIVVTKPSLYDMAKRYIVMFDVVEKPDTLYMKLEGATGGTWKCDLSSQKLIDSVGRYYLISNVSSVQHKQIKLTNTLSSSERCIVTNVNVIEYQNGMENWDIPYFEGMQSVKMPVLKTTGKNLLPPVRNEWYPCRFKKGTTFKLSTKDSVPSNGGNVVFKDINGTSIWFGIDSGNTTSTKVLPCDVYYISNSLATGVEHQLEIGKQVTSYEPYKTNILHTPEEVVLKGIGDVKDTLNCNTGEMVERIGEIVYTGDEDWKTTTMDQIPDNIGFYLPLSNHLNDTNNTTMRELVKDNLGFTNNCFSATINTPKLNGKKGFSIHNNGNVYFTIPTSECANVSAWKNKLKEQPLVLQYAINPTVKTVDLSTSGNWEKIVLDGKSSEDWKQNSHSGNFVQFEGYSNFCLYSMNLPVSNRGLLCDKLSYYGYDSKFRHTKVEGISDGGGYRLIFVRVKTEKLPTNDVAGFKQWLSQNPIEVSYMLSSNKDSTQVKQPIFFKDGHIIQSSGADNSLIPTLDYQAKTSNSYVMDLMKANTRYTMKAKSANGTFTIDGASYGAGTNGTFTTPSSMTNKFLVMSKKTNEEVMIIEGDVISKTIPYFKDIKSAFEGEDKIEVLSTGKNLFDGAFEKGMIDVNGNLGYTPTAIRTVNYISVKPNTSYHINLLNLEPFESFRVIYVHEYDENFKVLGEMQVDNRNIYTSKSATKFIKINTHTAHDLPVDSKMIVCENSTLDKQYEPYKSNSTRIPLLSPLRSLPNGVYDELIIDRMKKKATLIQRIKSTVFNGSEGWSLNGYSHDKLVEFVCHSGTQLAHTVLSDRFATGGENVERVAFASGSIYIRILKTKASNVDSFKKWLSQNPLTVQCGLQTPLVTEVDLEGFPYIYKDGHIFLNGKIVPTTEIIYSVNQCQQISASNEDIIRHEKELTYLQKLIAQYVQVDYESALLSLKV